jgi:hypothetical protein
MKYITLMLLLYIMAAGCNNPTTTSVNKANTAALAQTPRDTTPRIVGIGGIFFKAQNPKETKEWYSRHLGLVTNQYGATFEFRNANRPEEINYLQWSTFNEKTKYFDPSPKQFMINYRVQNLEAMVDSVLTTFGEKTTK